jgi:hypothetical protein
MCKPARLPASWCANVLGSEQEQLGISACALFDGLLVCWCMREHSMHGDVVMGILCAGPCCAQRDGSVLPGMVHTQHTLLKHLRPQQTWATGDMHVCLKVGLLCRLNYERSPM